MKDLQEIKEEVSTELGYKSNSVFSAHEQLLINPHGLNYKVISNSIDKIAIRYAQEQNKELSFEINESIKDLLCMQVSINEAMKTDSRWEGMYELLQKQIDRKKELIKTAQGD